MSSESPVRCSLGFQGRGVPTKDFSEIEPLLEQFLKFAPDAIVGVDRAGSIVVANSQVANVFGYTPDEIIGQPLETLVPLSMRGQHYLHRETYFKDPRTRSMGAGLDLFGLRADGTEFPAEISLSSIETGDGVIAIAAIRDVTDRKRAERKFEQLLELAPDAVVGIDKSGLMVLVNAQVERLFGYPRDQLLGQTIEMLVPERYRSTHSAHRSSYFSDPKTRPMGAGLDLHGLRADGTEFPAEISLSSIQTDEGVIAVAAIRDITERVHAESVRQMLEAELKLNQSRRLESVGQLAGGVAHDFNNLLTVIINYSEFLSGNLVENPELRADAEQIGKAAQRAADLTRQLLIFSRRDVVKPEPLVLNETIADIETLLRRTLGEQIELRTNFDPELWTVLVDRGQLEQVVMNLVVNGRDAMDGVGVLDISTANVELDEEYVRFNPDSIRPGNYVRMTVSDSGCGMDRDTIERAFEPFFTTKDKSEGTGLGLATVHGIVKQAGGNIFLYSEVGSGTSVKIHLPAVDSTLPNGPSKPERAREGRGEAIVVVEDEPAVRTMVTRILSNNGYRVAQFSNAREALAYFDSTSDPIDLLLTDIMMPEVTGDQLAEAVRSGRPDLPVLFMTGYSEAIIERQATRPDNSDLLEKPFTSHQILLAVGKSIAAAH